jgi:hypothetical protein
MSSLLLSRRLKIALAALLPLYLSGCSNNSIPTPTPTPSNPFANVVFIGDSLTAGFQNGSLLDTQQPNGYANLVAVQAKAAITLPLIAPPGAPAVLKLLSTSFPPVVMAESGTTTGRDNPAQQPTDLAVPGHMLHDVINYAPPVLATWFSVFRSATPSRSLPKPSRSSPLPSLYGPATTMRCRPTRAERPPR